MRGKEFIVNKIVSAMMVLLETKELNKITSDEIASMAEVSKRTLYKYFDSKTAMYLCVIERCFKMMNDYISKQVGDYSKLTSSELITGIGRAYLIFILKYPHESKIITAYDENDYLEAYPLEVSSILKISNMFTPMKFIAPLAEELELSEDEAKSLSIMCHASLLGLSTLIQHKKAWMKDFYEHSVEEIIDNHLFLMMVMLRRK